MKLIFRWSLLVLVLGSADIRGAESIDDAMKRASVDYEQRMKVANEELVRARAKIAQEKAPLVQAMRAAEERIIAAEAEITRLETTQEEAGERRRKLSKDADGLRRNENYLNTLARDSWVAFDDGLRPGERQFLLPASRELRDRFADANATAWPAPAAVAGSLLSQVKLSLGGARAAGTSLLDGNSQLVPGTFAFVGPEVFFRPDAGGLAGTVRLREGAGTAVASPLPEWKPAEAAAFFEGRLGTFPADASGGKALRLQETKGTVWQHVRKGGYVSFAILGVGALALFLIAQKIRDLTQMKVDAPAKVQRCLEALAGEREGESAALIRSLGPTVREVFSTGLKYRAESRTRLEERLTAVLLRQRLHFERRLPLLAVIATAAPLMGLLGTVTGMVKTFTLITVFGTGNAGKLASGISEVLVATELGLMVAIPALVTHGFLSQRIQKNLALLERYALEFVTVAGADEAPADAKERVSA